MEFKLVPLCMVVTLDQQYCTFNIIRLLRTNSGCGKERRMLIGPSWPAKAAVVRNYLELNGPVPADSRQ